MVEERRRHPRAAFPTVRVRLAASDGYHDEFMQDLSAGGMLLRTERTLPVGSHVEAEILRPHAEVLRMDGLVVRLELADAPEVPGMAIQFVGVPDVVGVDLEKLVEPFTLAFRTPQSPEPVSASIEVLNGEIQSLRSRLESVRAGELGERGVASGKGESSPSAGQNTDTHATGDRLIAEHEARESMALLERELERERELRKTLEQERDTYKASATELRDEAQAAIGLRTRVAELENRLLNAEELVRVAESVAEEAVWRLERLGPTAALARPQDESEPSAGDEAETVTATQSEEEPPVADDGPHLEAGPSAGAESESPEVLGADVPTERVGLEDASQPASWVAGAEPEAIVDSRVESTRDSATSDPPTPLDGDDAVPTADVVVDSEAHEGTEPLDPVDPVDPVELAGEEASLLIDTPDASSSVGDPSGAEPHEAAPTSPTGDAEPLFDVVDSADGTAPEEPSGEPSAEDPVELQCRRRA